MTHIVFWQSMITPHQAGLARALAACQGVKVTYVATQEVREDRAAIGWRAPDLGDAQLVLATTPSEIIALAQRFEPGAVHLCPGFRGNGPISHALPALASQDARIGVMMEMVDQRGKAGWLKAPLYKHQINRYRKAVAFCLAIGADAGRFIAQCGYPADRIYPFSYFLDAPAPSDVPAPPRRVVYAGRLVQLKRVDMVITAFGALQHPEATLSIVGSGPLEDQLRSLAAAQPNAGAIEWLGALPNDAARDVIASADCLVLPSEYDGWGAVVSEALLAGTPAICSSACGAAIAVTHSGEGSVFTSQDTNELTHALRTQLAPGPWTKGQRAALAYWAQHSLSAEAGAAYLEALISETAQGFPPPVAPWTLPHPVEFPLKIKTFVTA